MKTVTFGIRRKTLDELDAIALRDCCVVGSLVESENIQRGDLTGNLYGEYEPRWEQDQRQPSSFRLTIKPISMRATAMVHQGRVNWFQTFGLTTEEATIVASMNVPGRMEVAYLIKPCQLSTEHRQAVRDRLRLKTKDWYTKYQDVFTISDSILNVSPSEAYTLLRIVEGLDKELSKKQMRKVA